MKSSVTNVVRSSVVIFFLVVAALQAADPPLEELIDPATGVVDGQTAIAIFPLRFEGRRATGALPVEGCTAVLKSRADYELLTRPCGEWFLVPPDNYDFWVEKEWQISPFARKLVYFGGAFDGKGIVTGMPLEPAGRVALPRNFETRDELELRVIHSETVEIDGFFATAISRRTPFVEVLDGVLTPAGTTLAAVWDHRKASYVLLSRPFEVRHRKTTIPPLEEPEPDEAFAVVQIVRHVKAMELSDDTVELRLRTAGEERSPDHRFSTAEQVFGIWYDLPPGDAELHATAADAFLEPLSVELGSGRTVRVVGEMVGRSADGAVTD